MQRSALRSSRVHRPFTRRLGWLLAAVWTVGLSTGVAQAGADASMLDLQLELTALVEEHEPGSVEVLRERVAQGLPPAALTAMLDACLEHPRSDLEPLVRDLAMHRTAAIRARALLAWAGLGPSASVEAIEAAADDGDAGVRRLAVVLGRLHPSDRAEAVLGELLARDNALAKELTAEHLQAPPTASEDAS